MEANLVGLEAKDVRQVKFVLREVCGNASLASYYEGCVLIIEHLVNLIMTEIASTKKDLAYWEGVSSASPLEMAYMRSQLYTARVITALYEEAAGLSKQAEVPLSSRLLMTREKINKVLRKMSMIGGKLGSNRGENVSASSTSYRPFSADASEGADEATASTTSHRQRSATALYLSARSTASTSGGSLYTEIMESVEKNIFVLRFDLQQLACMLASVKEAAEHLRFVFTEVAVTTQRTVTSKASNQPSFLHPALADQFLSFALEQIQNALRDLSGTTQTYDLQNVSLQHVERSLHGNHTTMSMMYGGLHWGLKAFGGPFFGGVGGNESFGRSPSRDSLSGGASYGQHVIVEEAESDRNREMLRDIKRNFQEMHDLVGSLETSDYPIQITDAYARRPSRLERLWLRDFLICVACTAAVTKLNGMYKSGALQKVYVSCVEFMANSVKDHIIEPLTDLSKYLFERIKNDADLIVTRRELSKSRADLKLMLDGYKKLYPVETHEPVAVPAQNVRAGDVSGPTLEPPLPGALTSRQDAGAEQRRDSGAAPASALAATPSRALAGSDPEPAPGAAAPPVSENSMLPLVAESLKRVTDSASATIDSVLKAAKDTREAISKTELKLNPPDLSEFELKSSASKSEAAPNQRLAVTGNDKKVGTVLDVSEELPATNELSKRDIQEFEASIDKAMSSLMNRYVTEIKSPLKGMLFGSLVTGALIQVQKVKVMTEAAMMRMDQVLASNQLTMAGTAAMPAFMLISGVALLTRKLFSSSPPSHGEKTLRLRLALTSVERSLQAVYSTKAQECLPLGGSSRGGSGVEGGMSGNIVQETPFVWTNAATSSPRRVRERNSTSSTSDSNAFGNQTSSPENACSPEVTEPLSSTSTAISPLGKLFIETKAPSGNSKPQSPTLAPSTPKPDLAASGAQAPPQYSDRATFKYTENSTLINRGSLCFDIMELRKELMSAFTPRYQRNLPSTMWFRRSGLRRGRRQSLFRLLYRFVFGDVADFDDELEYQSIVCDINNLEAPDSEVDGLKKISIATRMRNSYRCFNS